MPSHRPVGDLTPTKSRRPPDFAVTTTRLSPSPRRGRRTPAPAAGALRFGGGLTAVIVRLHALDIALSADVTHVRVVASAGGVPAFASTSVQGGLSLAFDPGLVFDDD